MPKISRRAAIAPFLAMDVMGRANRRAEAGGDVVHLEVGQPSTGAPRRVIEAAQAALATDRLGYTEALGRPALRARIARHYRETYGVEIDPGQVIVTTGSSGGFVLAFLALFDPGDRVALASPTYPAYRNLLTSLGLVPVELPGRPEDGYQLSVELLERLDHPVEGVLAMSPANPTGTMLDRAALAGIADWCASNGVRLISDEIYHGITFGQPSLTALSVSDQAVVVNGFSKYFSMTGWRLGWMVVPPELERPIECLAQNLTVAPPTLAQAGALVAFDCKDELDANVARYAANRRVLLDGLKAAGIERIAPPDGAFYLYADVGDFTNDSTAFAQRLLDETGVAVTPGLDFDLERGHRAIRIAFPGATEEMESAVARIAAWLRR